MTWEEQLNELYQEYFGRDADPGGIRTYSKSHWKGNIGRMREELRDSPEHRDFLQSDVYQEREATAAAENQPVIKDYWAGATEQRPGVGIRRDIRDEYTQAAEEYVHFHGDEDDTRDSPTEFDKLETRFVEELYGTDGDSTTDGAIAAGEVTWQWGLDLRRTVPESLEFGTTEYYEHLTRGEVDWGNYQDDPKYIKAFSDLGYDLTQLGHKERESAAQVREATAHIGLKELRKGDTDSWKMHWEGQYDPDKIYRDKEGSLYMANEDGQIERQQTLSDLYAAGGGRLSVNKPGEHEAMVGPSRTVTRPNIPGVTWTPTGGGWDRPSLTNPTQARLPGNIPREWVNRTPTNPPPRTAPASTGGDK